MTSRGILVVFEGCDKTGKTTWSTQLQESLEKEDYSTRLLCFPKRDTPTGIMLNNYLKSTIELNKQVQHLLFSANRWEQNDFIKEMLAKGVMVICDRYVLSGLVYSTVLHGLDFEWSKGADKGLIKPDLTFLMTRDFGKSEVLGSERFENSSDQQRVQQSFIEHSNLVMSPGEVVEVRAPISGSLSRQPFLDNLLGHVRRVNESKEEQFLHF